MQAIAAFSMKFESNFAELYLKPCIYLFYKIDSKISVYDTVCQFDTHCVQCALVDRMINIVFFAHVFGSLTLVRNAESR